MPTIDGVDTSLFCSDNKFTDEIFAGFGYFYIFANESFKIRAPLLVRMRRLTKQSVVNTTAA